MESVDGQSKTCILEDTTTVIFDAPANARLKRMEIRRFKKLSMHASGSMKINKRSRQFLSAASCDLCAGIGPLTKAETVDDVTLAPQLVVKVGAGVIGHNLISAIEGGYQQSALARSKSFPPEGWHASKCILHICKASRTHTAGESSGRIATAISHDHGGMMEDQSLAIKDLAQKLVQHGQSSGVAQLVNNSPSLESLKPSACPFSEQDNLISQRSKMQALVSELPEILVSDATQTNMEVEVSPEGGPVISAGTLDGVPHERSVRSQGSYPPSGKVLICGQRREMEDTAVIRPSFAKLRCGCCCDGKQGSMTCADLHFFAVYDGHGGPQASNYCMRRLHHALAEELSNLSLLEASKNKVEDEWTQKWQKVMSSCFLKMDKEVGGVCPYGECDDVDSAATCCSDTIAPENVGTTAVVAVMNSCQIVIANCGDSRAVLSRGGESIPLSTDHKPERSDETSRIEAAGGRVIFWDGHRVGGLLALSRAIGDRYLKRYVVSEPEVTCVERTDADECLILASDGLWNVISNDTACEVARRCLATAHRKGDPGVYPPGEDPASASVAALLVKLAYGRGSKDNISVVVIDLKARGK